MSNSCVWFFSMIDLLFKDTFIICLCDAILFSYSWFPQFLLEEALIKVAQFWLNLSIQNHRWVALVDDYLSAPCSLSRKLIFYLHLLNEQMLITSLLMLMLSCITLCMLIVFQLYILQMQIDCSLKYLVGLCRTRENHVRILYIFTIY